MSQTPVVVDKQGWNGFVLMLSKMIGELMFWEKNLRILNGQSIRKRAGVMVVHPKMLCSGAHGRRRHHRGQQGL